MEWGGEREQGFRAVQGEANLIWALYGSYGIIEKPHHVAVLRSQFLTPRTIPGLLRLVSQRYHTSCSKFYNSLCTQERRPAGVKAARLGVPHHTMNNFDNRDTDDTFAACRHAPCGTFRGYEKLLTRLGDPEHPLQLHVRA